jgi:WW domain-containing oxidoreductase
MAGKAIPPFGKRTTAEEVLAGLGLTGQTILVTGCNAGIGFETLRALAAHGAHVIGLARSQETATAACAKAPGETTPIACDLADAASIAGAIAAVKGTGRPLDAIVANAGIMALPKLQTRDGVELQFLVNHIGHFQLVTGLLDQVRDQTGRIAIVSSSAGVSWAPKDGILFDNLDGSRFYRPTLFYGQSKLANALFAKELSRRVGRGIVVNSLHPGVIASTSLGRHLGGLGGVLFSLAAPFTKSIAQGAATQVLLVAHPSVAGVTGEYWADCRIVRGNPLLADTALAQRLWTVSEEIVARRLGV